MKWRLYTALALLLALAAAAIAHGLAERLALRETLAVASDRASLARRALASEIARFAALPDVVAQDGRIAAVLAEPDNRENVSAANAYLMRLAAVASASEVFLMDGSGLTLAASNHDSFQSFVGRNYGFRPYFRDALRTGSGRFYAVGATTSIPGLFLARRVESGSGTGVVVVKMDLNALELSWREAAPGLSLVDRHGVIFLSGNVGDLYRSIRPLSDEERARIEETRQYGAAPVGRGDPLLSDDGARRLAQDGHALHDGALFVASSFDLLGWSFLYRVDNAPPWRAPALAGAVSGGLVLLVMAVVFAAMQRWRLVQERLAQNARLERLVSERTEKLVAAQDELVAAAKMSALGRMSAAIIHEISQPLVAMETATATAGKLVTAGGGPEAEKALSRVRSLVSRMRRMVTNLRSFSRPSRENLQAIDLHASLQAVLALVSERLAASGGQVVWSGPTDAPDVLAGQVRLEQVLTNIILNALDACASVPVTPHVTVAAATDGEDGVMITVTDNGCGLGDDPEFDPVEPFASTKTQSESLGLGLSISQALMDSFGGGLTIANRPDARGAVVSLRFRRAGVQP